MIEDVALSSELEQAIEAKMVQQQEAEKAIFKMQQARTDAETLIIKAKADAEAITIQGEALEKAPTARRPEDGREVERRVAAGGRVRLEHHAAARQAR